MDFRRIISDVGFSAGRILLVVLRSLIVVPIITKLISVEAYGLWASILAIVSLFMTVGGLHLHGALIRYSSSESQQTFSDTLTLVTISAVFVSTAFVLAGVLFSGVIESVLSIPPDLFLSAGFLLGAQILTQYMLNYPRALSRVKRYEILRSIRLILETIVLGVTLYWTRDVVAAIYAIATTDLLLTTALFGAYLWKSTFPLPEASNFRRYLNYGVPMVAKGLSESVISYTDKIIFLVLSGPAVTGVYAVAYGITKLLTRPGNLFNSTLYPNVTAAWDRGEYDELSKLYQEFLRGNTLLLVPTVFGLTVLAREAIRLISTPSIAEQGWLVVPILSIGFAMQGLESTFSYPLAANEQTRYISLITFVVAVLNTVLNVLLIPTLGLIGGGIATTLAYTVRSVWLVYLTRKLFQVRIPWCTLSKSIGASVLMVVLLLFLPINQWYVRLVLYPLLGASSYMIMILLFKGVTTRDIEMIRTLVQ